MQLNPKSVLVEIEKLQENIGNFLDKSIGDFQKIHGDVISLCEEIFSKKSDYEKISKAPFSGDVVQVIISDRDGNKKQIKIPSDEQIIEDLKETAKEMLVILEKAHKKYSLKLKLSM